MSLLIDSKLSKEVWWFLLFVRIQILGFLLWGFMHSIQTRQYIWRSCCCLYFPIYQMEDCGMLFCERFRGVIPWWQCPVPIANSPEALKRKKTANLHLRLDLKMHGSSTLLLGIFTVYINQIHDTLSRNPAFFDYNPGGLTLQMAGFARVGHLFPVPASRNDTDGFRSENESNSERWDWTSSLQS